MKTFILLTIMLLAVSCGSSSKKPNSLPVGAYDIVDVGNGWSEFTYKDQRILFCNKYLGYKGYQSMCVIGRTGNE